MLFAIANTLTAHGVRPTTVKDQVETTGKVAYDRWNSFSRITVSKEEMVQPAMFGASPHLPHSTLGSGRSIIDGGAGTALYRFDGNHESLDFLRYDVTNLAYVLPNLKTGAVMTDWSDEETDDPHYADRRKVLDAALGFAASKRRSPPPGARA